MSGASGFIGGSLSSFLREKKHEVFKLVRSGVRDRFSILWDPEKGILEKEALAGFDACIHLAGEPLTLTRWNRAKRERILQSRKKGTLLLSNALSKLSHPPKFFLSASAVGFYGDREDEILDEKSSSGKSFLSEVCREWESGSRVLEEKGVRVVRTRFAVVLGPKGGALQKMLLPYRLGLGGRLGTGRQWMSWVAREDLIRAIEFILMKEEIRGIVNISSPHPVRQEEFSKTLARVLHRPAFFSVPAWALRLLLGKTADEMLLMSARVLPRVLESFGFLFQYPYLERALEKALSNQS